MNQRDLLMIGGGVLAGVALAALFPRVRRNFGPILMEAGQRAGEIFSDMAASASNGMGAAHEYAHRQPAPAHN